VHDENGTALPLVMEDEAIGLAGEALVELSRDILSEEPSVTASASMEGMIRKLPSLPARDAQRRVEEWRAREGGSAWRRVAEDLDFAGMASTLAQRTVLLAATSLDARQRRTVTFTYEQRIERASGEQRSRAGWGRRALESLGWAERPLELVARDASPAERHRVELWIPGADLELRAPSLEPASDDGSGPAMSLNHRRDRIVISLKPTAASYRLSTKLAARRSAFLIHCLLTVGFVAVVLGFGAVRMGHVRDETDAMTTLLGLLPAIFVGLLVRQGEHGMATVIFSNLRRLLLLVAAAALAAVLLLVGGFSTTLLRIAWIVSGTIAVAVLVVVLGNLVAPRLRSSRAGGG